MNTNLTIQKLHQNYNKLQKIYGDNSLDPIYGAGCIENPQICFIFMNPTARNIASFKSWQGLKAPWIGTKNIWRLFHKLDLIDTELFQETQKRKSAEWDPELAYDIYNHLSSKRIFLTNLAKCTQLDARPLPNNVFKQYLDMTKDEIANIKPQRVISFGNQVSSILTGQPISVSKWRRKAVQLKVKNQQYNVYPVYYPVGQGMRNIDKAIEDIKYVMSTST